MKAPEVKRSPRNVIAPSADIYSAGKILEKIKAKVILSTGKEGW